MRLPGDKSISHRAAILAAVAEGTSRIRNFSSSIDCASTLRCIEMLGAKVECDGSDVIVRGCGPIGLKPPAEHLDCGNSGTTMRLLAGVLAGQSFESVLIGDESLSRRPMMRVAEPLGLMGAQIETSDGHAPIRIVGRRPLKDIEYRLPVPSAQVKSAVLLAGLFADGQTTVIERTPTRDHTERMLPAFGAKLSIQETDSGKKISLFGGPLNGAEFSIPGDVSAAAFFLVAAACLPESEVHIENVGLNPTRTAILKVLANAGATFSIVNERLEGGEPAGDLIITGGIAKQHRGAPLVLRGDIIANLIDEAPILAILGTQLPGGIEIRDAAELRHKESDRIDAVCYGLRQMGANIEEFGDGFRVGQSRLSGAEIDSRGDHRIAMAFAIAGLMAEGETIIKSADSAAVSFPDFFERLNELGDSGVAVSVRS